MRGPGPFVFTKNIDNYFLGINSALQFVKRIFREGFKAPLHFREIVNQCYDVGIKALPLISLTGFITGMVFTKQSRPSLETFGATSWLPSLISIAIVRALGSLVTALICSGKVGSSIGAELGSMRVTEQIDAMEVSGTNPFKYLVVTRVFAAILMLPLLVIISDTVSLYGAFVGINMKQEVSFHLFSIQVFQKLTFSDVLPSVVKSLFFGFAIGIIGCYKGYYTKNGTRGVGLAANTAVVLSTFAVFIIDLIAAQVADIFNYT